MALVLNWEGLVSSLKTELANQDYFFVGSLQKNTDSGKIYGRIEAKWNQVFP